MKKNLRRSYFIHWVGALLCFSLLLWSCSDNSTNIKKKPQFKTDVYVAGRADSNAVYWKNGTSHKLGDNANAHSIDVSDGNVYVARQTDADNNGYPDNNAVYWKNGTIHRLTEGKPESTATSIYVTKTEAK